MANMQVGRYVCLSLLLGVSACAAQPTQSLDYTVLVDPSFDMDQQGAAISGIADWTAAVPELTLKPVIEPCTAPSAQQICLLPEYAQPDPPLQVVGTTYRGASESGTVYIYVNRIDALSGDAMGLTRQTVAHELGHAMGLQHQGMDTLMAASVSDQAPAVTAADVAQFWSGPRAIAPRRPSRLFLSRVPPRSTAQCAACRAVRGPTV